MTKVIFLNGPPGSGKDESAKQLKLINRLVFRYAFADILKTMFCDALLGPGYRFPEGKAKDEPMPPPYSNVTWRQGVINFSENFMKPSFGKNIFGHLLLGNIDPHAKIIAITDSGFAEEGQVLTSHFGKKNCCLVQLERFGCNFLTDSRSYLVADDVGADFTIFLKNDGTLEHLQSELRVLEKWMNL